MLTIMRFFTTRILIISLCCVWYVAVAPTAHAEDGWEELARCKAGQSIDLPCMKKRRAHFEKYVISANDFYLRKQVVAQALASYYERSGESPTDQSRVVLKKLGGLNGAVAISHEVYKTSSADYQEREREAAIRIKEYLTNLDPMLYASDIKDLEWRMKRKSDGTGFWNQVLKTVNDSGVIEAAGKSTSH